MSGSIDFRGLDFNGFDLTRRTFLRGVGGAALASLLPAQETRGRGRGVVDPPHIAPRARRVIHLCQAGGPSHLETLDFKPKLAEMHGEKMPESFTAGQQIAQLQGIELRCFAPQHPFQRYGESGQSICSLFPGVGSIADKICIVRSMQTDQINHDPAHTQMNTGSGLTGRPGMGAWAVYGLGNESSDLPGYVVLTSVGKGGQSQPIAARQWSSGFLPSRFQGVHFRSEADPVLYVNSPNGVTRGRQRDVIDAVSELDAIRDAASHDPEIATRIRQYELAFRMQTSVPELMDVSDEPEETFELYGTRGGDGTYAANCLLARRLAERGVRFIQLYHRAWDHHSNVKGSMEITAKEVDQASAALVIDLERRGLLDDTLVIWGGEFGRTPMGQGSGRDHHIKGFSLWMAGGGVRGGISHGETDELGYAATVDAVHVNDLHATLLHLLGIEHERLTFPHQGRDYRLTDVAGRVLNEILG
ncbi:MAG: DUF1501 domain-containing protein [bacterium]|nr:DUF1501 domain-containing protein [bacterium]